MYAGTRKQPTQLTSSIYDAYTSLQPRFIESMGSSGSENDPKMEVYCTNLYYISFGH